MSSLGMLPNDVLLETMRYLRVRDILALRKTCKDLYYITKFKRVWLFMLEKISNSGERLLQVPPYCRPIDTLSSSETEILVRHGFRLQCRLSSSSHAATAKLFPQPRPVTWLQLIQGQWLLVASSDSSTSVLQLWSLSAMLSYRCTHTIPNPVAETFLSGPVCDGRAIVIHGEIIIAIDIRSSKPWMELLAVRTHAQQSVFTRIAHLPNVSHIRCMDETFIGFALYDETSIPCLLHWRSGNVVKLNQKPRLKGGCVAMAILGDLVATISPGKLELFTVKSSVPFCSRRLHEWEIFDQFSGVSLVFETLPRFPTQIGPQPLSLTLRVYIAEQSALHVFDIKIPYDHQELAAELCETWTHQPDPFTDEYYPRFGATSTMLTWFKGPGNELEPVAFVACQVTAPTLAEMHVEATPAPYEFVDADMPALYSFGVRDYDETRGILALGNAFGEMAVYDLSGTCDVEELESCFNQIHFPLISTEEMMPLTPVPAKAVPPYPYSRSYWPKIEERSSFIESWRPYQPDVLPAGWHTNLLPSSSLLGELLSPWAAYVPAVGTEAWWREHGQFYYGTLRPIMRFQDMLTVSRAGGLLFFDYDENSFVHVVRDEDFSPDDIERISAGEIEVPSIARQAGDPTMYYVKKRFLKMRDWEWIMFGRNRWQELKDRGGEVDAYWLDEKPELEEFTCIGPHCD